MRRLFLIGCLLLVALAPAETQTSLSGRWRAVLLLPDGSFQNIGLELAAKGDAITGSLEGRAFREGRLDGNSLTLKLNGPNNEDVSLVGQVSGDEILFKSSGLPFGPVQFVARRAAQNTVEGSVSDPAVVQRLLKEFNVPGVSIAVINDFKIAATYAYGIADVDSGAPVTTETMFQAASISKPVAAMLSLKAVQDVVGKPFAEIARDWVLNPIGMTNSTFEQPLPQAREKQAARAHNRTGMRMGDPWHVYPEQAAAGLWTTPTDPARLAIEVQQSLLGKSNRVLSQTTVREMVTPVGVGPYAVGFQIGKDGEGWYFMHGGSNWGFQCDLIAHRVNGYGAVIMTNGDNGGALISRLRRLIQQEYKWDALDAPIPRRYGPA